MSFYAYVLECKNGAFYTGWTNDIDCRVRLHFEGKGAKYTRANPPVKLAAKWQFDSKIEAMQFEWRFKQLPRRKKLEAIANAESNDRAG